MYNHKLLRYAPHGELIGQNRNLHFRGGSLSLATPSLAMENTLKTSACCEDPHTHSFRLN
jgi:hypothetical protein